MWSPERFCIMFINDIVHLVVDGRCCLFLYADHIHVFFKEADISGLEELVDSIVLSFSFISMIMAMVVLLIFVWRFCDCGTC